MLVGVKRTLGGDGEEVVRGGGVDSLLYRNLQLFDSSLHPHG